MLKFFRFPFGTSGDRAAIPDAVDSNGNVSYAQGYGPDYQRQKDDPAAKNIERNKQNQLFFDVTNAIAEIQSQGIPDYITSALNGGTAFSYGAGAVVRYNSANYISLAAANTALPSDATKWALLPTPALLQQAAYNSAVAGGTADALTASFSPAIAALPTAPGALSVLIRHSATNTTTNPTLAVDARAAKTVVKGANTALLPGDILSGAWGWYIYDATLDRWVLQNPAGVVNAGNLQAQAYTAFTTAGTAPAFTLTPSPALTSYTGRKRFCVTFHAAGTTGSNTLDISGLGAKNLKQYDALGNKVPAQVAAGVFDVAHDGTDLIILDSLPASDAKLTSLTATVAANALTVSLPSCTLDFRSGDLTSGSAVTRSVASTISLTVPSGATLGTVSGQGERLIVAAIDNAGTVELAICNVSGGLSLAETGLISTTAISAASSSNAVWYSATARTNVAYRVVGSISIAESTAGTWATGPTNVQNGGTLNLASLNSLGFGQTWQDVTASRAFGTTYYNTTGRPISLNIGGLTSSQNGSIIISVNGVALPNCTGASGGASNTTGGNFAVIPPGASYSATVVNSVTLSKWFELR